MRATGIDHFDPNYKDKPFEKRGIFKWSSNAMYTFAIAIFFWLCYFCRIKKQCLYLLLILILVCGYIISVQRKEDFKVIYGNNQVKIVSSGRTRKRH